MHRMHRPSTKSTYGRSRSRNLRACEHSGSVCLATEPPGKAVSSQYEDDVLTHTLTPCGAVPTAQDPNGVYPYVSCCETANRPVLRKYTFIVLENGHIKVTISPDLGGKVTSLVHKGSGQEVLYVPELIRPTRILPPLYVVVGGIEVSFLNDPSPTENEKVLHRSDRAKDRVYVTCSERELRFGMHWSVEYSLGPQDASGVAWVSRLATRLRNTPRGE